MKVPGILSTCFRFSCLQYLEYD